MSNFTVIGLNHYKYIQKRKNIRMLKRKYMEYVIYELDMFVFSYNVLLRTNETNYFQNIFLEDTLLHSRNLIDFLFNLKCNYIKNLPIKNRKDIIIIKDNTNNTTDIFFGTFLELNKSIYIKNLHENFDEDKLKFLFKFHYKINKKLSHLTKQRELNFQWYVKNLIKIQSYIFDAFDIFIDFMDKNDGIRNEFIKAKSLLKAKVDQNYESFKMELKIINKNIELFSDQKNSRNDLNQNEYNLAKSLGTKAAPSLSNSNFNWFSK